MLAGAAALLALFAFNEARSKNPLVPLAIFRIKGLPAADATQVIAMAGFYSMFFFLTLYMQNVLGFSPTRAGLAYVPVAAMVAVAAGVGTVLITRTGTRPLMVGGALIAAGGVFWLSHIPADGHYWTNLFPGLRGHGVRARRRLRRRADRVAGRGAATARRAGQRADQRVVPGRRRSRAGDLLRGRDLVDEHAARRRTWRAPPR